VEAKDEKAQGSAKDGGLQIKQNRIDEDLEAPLVAHVYAQVKLFLEWVARWWKNRKELFWNEASTHTFVFGARVWCYFEQGE
jgi:hypothetical protein